MLLLLQGDYHFDDDDDDDHDDDGENKLAVAHMHYGDVCCYSCKVMIILMVTVIMMSMTMMMNSITPGVLPTSHTDWEGQEVQVQV